MNSFIECKHTNQVWRYRIIHSNDTQHWGTQCLNCGKWMPRKKSEIPPYEMNRAGEYDPSIGEPGTQQHSEYLMQLSEYYKSSEWDRKRRARLRLNQKLCNGFCEICLDKPATHIHHVTYARLYSEWLLDLAATCEECHISQHTHMQSEA